VIAGATKRERPRRAGGGIFSRKSQIFARGNIFIWERKFLSLPRRKSTRDTPLWKSGEEGGGGFSSIRVQGTIYQILYGISCLAASFRKVFKKRVLKLM
jgi:hypothetical protein